MEYNKNRFTKINDHKILHKVKKQWVVLSMSMLAMLGGSVAVTHVAAHASANNNNINSQNDSVNVKNQINARLTKAQTNQNQARQTPTNQSQNSPSNNFTPANIDRQATVLHDQILRNVALAKNIQSVNGGNNEQNDNDNNNDSQKIADQNNKQTLHLGNSVQQKRSWNYIQHGVNGHDYDNSNVDNINDQNIQKNTRQRPKTKQAPVSEVGNASGTFNGLKYTSDGNGTITFTGHLTGNPSDFLSQGKYGSLSDNPVTDAKKLIFGTDKDPVNFKGQSSLQNMFNDSPVNTSSFTNTGAGITDIDFHNVTGMSGITNMEDTFGNSTKFGNLSNVEFGKGFDMAGAQNNDSGFIVSGVAFNKTADNYIAPNVLSSIHQNGFKNQKPSPMNNIIPSINPNNPNVHKNSYGGLNYMYDPKTKTAEFTSGSLTWTNPSNKSSDGFISGTNSSTPSDLKNAKYIKFDNNVNVNSIYSNNSSSAKGQRNWFIVNDPNVERIDLPSDFDNSAPNGDGGYNWHNAFESDTNLKSITVPNYFVDKYDGATNMFTKDNNLTKITILSTPTEASWVPTMQFGSSDGLSGNWYTQSDFNGSKSNPINLAGAALTPGKTYVRTAPPKPKNPKNPHAVLTNLTEGTAPVTIDGRNDTITVGNGTLDGSYAGNNEFASDILDKNGNPVSLPNNNKDWKVVFNGTTAPQSANSLFDGKHDVQGGTTNWFGHQVANIDLTGLNMNNVSDMTSFLLNNPNLQKVTFGNKNLSCVTNMKMALGSDPSLTSIDMSGLTAHGLKTMSDIFDTDPNLTSVKLSSGLSAKGPVDLQEMFASDTKLPFAYNNDSEHPQGINWNGFSTKTATNMSGMFRHDENLGNVVLPSTFDTSNVSDFGGAHGGDGMFQSDGDTKGKDYKGMTRLDLSRTNFDTSRATNMEDMFRNDKFLNHINFGNKFDTSKVTNMSLMFGYSDGISDLELPSTFNTKSNPNMSNMFESDVPDGGLKQLKIDSSDFHIQSDAWSWGNHNFYKELTTKKNQPIIGNGKPITHYSSPHDFTKGETAGTYTTIPNVKDTVEFMDYVSGNSDVKSSDIYSASTPSSTPSSKITKTVTPPSGYSFINGTNPAIQLDGTTHTFYVLPAGINHKLNIDLVYENYKGYPVSSKPIPIDMHYNFGRESYFYPSDLLIPTGYKLDENKTSSVYTASDTRLGINWTNNITPKIYLKPIDKNPVPGMSTITVHYYNQNGQQVGCNHDHSGMIGSQSSDIVNNTIPQGYTLKSDQDAKYEFLDNNRDVNIDVTGNQVTDNLLVNVITRDSDGNETVTHKIKSISGQVGNLATISPSDKAYGPSDYTPDSADQNRTERLNSDGTLSDPQITYVYNRIGRIYIHYVDSDGQQVGSGMVDPNKGNCNIGNSINILSDSNSKVYCDVDKPSGYQINNNQSDKVTLSNDVQDVIVPVKNNQSCTENIIVNQIKKDIYGNVIGITPVPSVNYKINSNGSISGNYMISGHAGDSATLDPYDYVPSGYHVANSDHNTSVKLNNGQTQVSFVYQQDYQASQTNLHTITIHYMDSNDGHEIDREYDHGTAGTPFDVKPYENDIPSGGDHYCYFDESNPHNQTNITSFNNVKQDVYIYVTQNNGSTNGASGTTGGPNNNSHDNPDNQY